MHRWSEGFSWTDRSGPFQSLDATQVAHFDELGFVLVEDAFDADTLADVLAEIDPIEHEREEELRRHGGTFFIARAGEITFNTHLVAVSEVLRRFVARPELLGICAELVGPDVRLYWDQAVYKKPGTTSPFPWHQDNGYAFIEPQQYLTCWIALTDATEENGCPLVVPRLHRKGTLAHQYSDIGLVCLEGAPEVVAVPARAGSIVVFSSLTPHCTGPNASLSVRKAYIVQYAPEGAAVITKGEDGQRVRTPATNPEWQFPVLSGGLPVA